MIRPVVLSLALTGPALAEGLDLTNEERQAFRAEVRAAILADPEPVALALNPSPPALYSDEVAADKARLADHADLFVHTDRGVGAEKPRLTIVFFESYPCMDCAAAWAEAEALLDRHPDVRIEPRFASDSGVAQLLLSVLEHEGMAAYRAARAVLSQAKTQPELEARLSEGHWRQDRMLRPRPAQEAAAFRALELEMAPSFVFPGLMLQGAMPLIVLEKYVAE